MKADPLPAPVLIVDDDEDDTYLLTRQLRTAGLRNPVLQFRNGSDAFRFLRRFGVSDRPQGPLPPVMFLDVNMHGLSGFDVLAWARRQPALHGMKIFMLSGANEEFDAQIAAQLGADDYFEKFPASTTLRDLLAHVGPTPHR